MPTIEATPRRAPRGRPPGVHGTDTERRLRQEGTRLFATRGYSGVGIREIAAACGFSVASLYHYVATKDELLERVMLQTLAELTEQAARLQRETPDPVDQLTGLIEMSVVFHALNPMTARVVDREVDALSAASRDRVVAARDAYEQVWSTTIDAGIAAGEIDVRHAGLLRLALLGMCAEVAYWYSPSGALSVREVVDTFVTMGLALARSGSGGSTDGSTDVRPWVIDRIGFTLDDALFTSEPPAAEGGRP